MSAATQCAWCRRFYDAAGFVDHDPAATDLVNHGICYQCLDAVLRQEVERLIVEGDHREARAAERRRAATAARLARQRDRALRERAGLSTAMARIAAELVGRVDEPSRPNAGSGTAEAPRSSPEPSASVTPNGPPVLTP